MIGGSESCTAQAISRDLGQSPSQPPDVARDDDAMLGEDATYLIHELRPATHQALAYPMEGLDPWILA